MASTRTGEIEPHVVYDMAASGYRAQLRCRCSAVCTMGKRLRPSYDDAEADSHAMQATYRAKMRPHQDAARSIEGR